MPEVQCFSEECLEVGAAWLFKTHVQSGHVAYYTNCLPDTVSHQELLNAVTVLNTNKDNKRSHNCAIQTPNVWKVYIHTYIHTWDLKQHSMCRPILRNIQASYLSSSMWDKHWRYFMCLSSMSSSPRLCPRLSAQLCAPWRCCCSVLERTLSFWSKVSSLDRDSSAAASAADTRKGTELDTVTTYRWALPMLKMHYYDITDLRVSRWDTNPKLAPF